MKALSITSKFLLLSLLLIQGKAQDPLPGLQLGLVPGEILHGIPQSFTFRLINFSNHNLWVAGLAVECTNTYDGYLSLRLKFTPSQSSASEMGGGCVEDKFFLKAPNILDRVKEWKLLPPGEAVEKRASSAELLYASEQKGIYEFWAEYTPPALQPEERQALHERGIDFPEEKLSTAHLTFSKP